MKEKPHELHKLKNIGKKTALWLHEVEVHTPADLERLGAVEVYLRLQQAFPGKVTLMALYALEGAIWGLHWNLVPEEVKARLREQVKRLGG